MNFQQEPIRRREGALGEVDCREALAAKDEGAPAEAPQIPPGAMHARAPRAADTEELYQVH